MSFDDKKGETSLGLELCKWFGVSVSIVTLVVSIFLLNPGLFSQLVCGAFLATPYGDTFAENMQSQLDILNEGQDSERKQDSKRKQDSNRTVDSAVKAPLGYGEGLKAFADLAENAVLKPQDIAARAKFPVTELGRCSPLGYSSLIGKKTKTTIKQGEFFTTANVEL